MCTPWVAWKCAVRSCRMKPWTDFRAGFISWVRGNLRLSERRPSLLEVCRAWANYANLRLSERRSSLLEVYRAWANYAKSWWIDFCLLEKRYSRTGDKGRNQMKSNRLLKVGDKTFRSLLGFIAWRWLAIFAYNFVCFIWKHLGLVRLFRFWTFDVGISLYADRM